MKMILIARSVWCALLGFAVSAQLLAAQEAACKVGNTLVTYSGIEERHAQAIARVVNSARNAAIGQFNFDMPGSVTVAVDCRPDNTVRLFNDGQDRLVLSLSSTDQLQAPSKSGVFHVYGLCHELGHLAMYRVIKRHDWLSTAAAEGWAHYVGSRLVDCVFAAEGAQLWPEAYDYRAEGTKRLEAQAKQSTKDEVTSGAVLWQELAGILGDRKLAPLLKALGEAAVDPADPAASVKPVLLSASHDPRLGQWWPRAEKLFFAKQSRSAFQAKSLPPSELQGRPAELACDDGKSAGQSSLAGGGHAVRFTCPAGQWYLTALRVYGARYGVETPRGESFSAWLCDKDGGVVQAYSLPYASFERGKAAWVKFSVPPTQAPAEFILCVGFNPSATKGVFMHYDEDASGNSLVGLPGKGFSPFGKGDWLIRAELDQARKSGALKP